MGVADTGFVVGMGGSVGMSYFVRFAACSAADVSSLLDVELLGRFDPHGISVSAVKSAMSSAARVLIMLQ